MEPRISVCVGVTRSDVVGDLVESLVAQTIDDWEAVLVCQRGATVETSDPRITVEHSDRIGRSAALNDARREASAALLAFTDDDCVMADDWLEVALRRMDAAPEVGMLGGSTLPPERTSRISACPMVIAIESTYSLAADGPDLPPGFQIPGANVIIRASLFDELGGFDEDLGAGTRYGCAEDLDLGVRAKHGGATLASTPELVNHHTHGERAGVINVLRHHRGYARGGGAFTAKWQPTGLEPGFTMHPVRRGMSAKTLLVHVITYPYRYAAFRSYRRDHPVLQG